MSTKHAQGISRRSFLAGTALASTGAVLGLAGCAPKENKGAEEANAETGSTSSDWLGSEPTVQESDIVETIDTEFLIVGAGTGGLFAACAAGEEGIETFVLEKYNGGVVRDDVGGVNSRLQQESGYTMDRSRPWCTTACRCCGCRRTAGFARVRDGTALSRNRGRPDYRSSRYCAPPWR